MNSFRVADTRFRILKGGKIGLSLSISLISSALIFSSTNAFADDYFTGVKSTLSSSTTTPASGDNPITVQKAENSDILLNSSIKTGNDTNPVVFKPTSWANSSYKDPTFSPAQTDPMYPQYPNRYILAKDDLPSLELNLTFDSGATSGSISKNSTTFYSANTTSPSYVPDVALIPTQTLTQTSSKNYKANLIFNGSNTVSGSTDIENGNIEIKGNTNFGGAVTAGSINMNTTNPTDTATFGSSVSLSSGTGTLNFGQNGNIILNSSFSGNITTTNNDGNITTIGTNNINGNIGTSSNSLDSLNIGNPTTISTTTINGDVFVDSTVLNNNGTTNNSTLILKDGSNITSNIISSNANMGILTLEGNSTVSGNVGVGNALKNVNSGLTGTTSTFKGTVNSENIINTGSGITNFEAAVTATNVNVNAGTSNFEKGLTATTTTITSGTGNFNTDGSSTTTTGIVFGGSGTANLNNGLTGDINFAGNNANVNVAKGDISGNITATGTNGKLNLNGTTIVSGTVGTNTTNRVSEINGINNTDATFVDNVFADKVNVNAGEMTFEKGLTATETTITTGTFNTDGSSTTSTDIVFGGIGTANLNNGLAGNINFAGNDAIVNVAKGDISGNITATGTKGNLNLNGITTVSGTVGTNATNRVSEINGILGTDGTFKENVFADKVNVDAGKMTFEKGLTATETTITTGTFNTDGSSTTTTGIVFGGSGTANLNNGLTGDINFAGNNANVNVAKGDISGNITATGTNGKLNLNGTTIVSGTVGTNTTNRVSEINGINNTDATFVDNVFADKVNVNAGEMTFEKGLTATETTITTGTFNTDGSSTTSTDIVFGGIGTANLNNGLAGNINFAGNDAIVNVAKGDISGNITATGTKGNLNLNGITTVSGTVGTNATNRVSEINGILGTDGTFKENVFADKVNVDAGKMTFEKGLTATETTITTGTFNTDGSSTTSTDIVFGGIGTANLNNGLTGDINFAGNNANVNVAKGDISGNITATGTNGKLNLNGTTIVSGTVGTNTTNRVSEINGINNTDATFVDNVFADKVNVDAGKMTFEKGLTATETTITTGTFNTDGSSTTSTDIVFGGIGTANLNNGLAGNINFAGNDAIVNVAKGDISGNITATGTKGNLNLNGITTVSGTVGTNATNRVSEINGILGTDGTFKENVFADKVNVDAGKMTFEKGLTATETTITTGTFNTDGSSTTSTDIVFGGIGTANLNNGLTGDINFAGNNANVNVAKGDISGNITATGTNGKLNLNGTTIVSGTVGTNTTNRVSEINGINNTDATFVDNVFADKVNVNAGEMTFEKDLTATTTTITSGTGNFNTDGSSTTTTGIVFGGSGTANLNNGLTGDINFAGNNANVNVSHEKGIFGSVQTLANNTGIVNYQGDGEITGNIGGKIGADYYGIRELNINTNNQQNSGGTGVIVAYDALAREIYADVINLRNNATLTLKDNVNLINTGLDNNIIKVDVGNTGKISFEGTSNIEGEVGESAKAVNTINAGAAGKTVTFDDMVYATNLKYIGAGTVVLNGDTTSNTAEGMVGTVDFDAKAGTLVIGDDVNIAAKPLGTQFANANNATLAFNGNSVMNEVLGGNTAGNSTFKEIQAGKDNKTVTFNDDVYALEKLLVSENGTVNLKGNLHSDLLFAKDGFVNVDDTKIIKNGIKTQNDGLGNVNFKGSTIVNGEIGTEAAKLKSVKFASEGTGAYTQSLGNNIYAVNTTIGNGINNNTINFDKDITFGGNLDVKDNSTLNIKDSRIIVKDNLNIADNSNLNFKVYTTDLSAGQAVENGKSGNINTSSLTMASDAKINIDYEGTWEGAGKYNLITSSSSTGSYSGTEANGLVKDNSIIDSVVRFDGTNLTLFADRTGGSSFNANDLYIETSGIGQDYSNGASQALAGYANEKKREGALADIIRDLEYLEGGRVVSEAKKQEMIKTQRLLTPTANGSNLQTSITASNLALSSINGRLGDVRRIGLSGFSPDYTGLSSGDTDIGYDSTLWMKAMGSKATQSSVARYDGYDTSTYGFVAGIDKTIDDDALYGIALAYSTTKTNQDNLASDSSDTKSIQATAYASKQFENAYVDGYLSYSQHKTDGTRTANSGKLASSVKSDQIGAKVEAGYNIPLNDGISVTPFASVEYGLINQKAYNEKGSKYQNDALKVDAVKLNKGTVALGAKLTTNIEFDDVLITPEFTASVYNSFGDNKSDIKAQFMGGGDKFVTPVQELNKTMYNVGMAVETKISDSTSLIFGVDYDRSKDGKFQAYSGNVTFGISF